MAARRLGTRVAPIAEVIGVAMLAVVYFAKVFGWRTGDPTRLGLGDWIDPYFINFLLEHWYQAIGHGADPLALGIFYPGSHALGYSHSLLLFAPFYAVVRPFLHPFLADTAALALVLVTGSVSLFVVFRRGLRLTLVEAVVTSAFFWTSANAVNGSTGIWEQRASIFLVPTIAVIGLWAMRGAATIPRQVAAGLAGFLIASLPTQDFYTGALTALVAVLIAPGMMAASPAEVVRRTVAAMRTGLRRADATSRPAPGVWWVAAGLAGLGVAAALTAHPIERVYIAGVGISAHRTAVLTAASLLALAYYGIRRWHVMASAASVVRSAVRALRIRASGLDPRVTAAGIGALAGLALFLVVYAGAFLERGSFPADQLLGSMKALTHDSWRDPGAWFTSNRPYPTLRSFGLVLVLAAVTWTMPLDAAPRWRRHARWFLAVSVIVLLIPYRFGDLTLWRAVFAPWPGLGAIRDPKRIIEPFELAIAVFAAAFLAQQRARPLGRGLIVAAMVALAAADWNDATFRYARDPAVFDRDVQAPIAVDPSCRSFFLRPEPAADTARSDNPASLYGVDASFVALDTGVPTLNGYSGWWPEDWRLSNPEDRNYVRDLDEWIASRHLHDVCALDLDARAMRPYLTGR